MTNNSKKIRLALLGASKIASKILGSIRSVESLEVYGVYSKDTAKAETFARQHDIARFGTYDEALKNNSIDAVYISVLNSDHYETVKQALAHGKHVLCEKPLVLSKSQAVDLFELAQSRKLVLLEALMYRFSPQIKRMHEVLASGQIGDVNSIRLNFSFILETEGTRRRTQAGGGGALNDVGCYAIDFLNSLMGTETISKITATSRTTSTEGGPIDLKTSALITYQNGVTASLECSIDQPAVNLWEISGTKGAVAALRYNPHAKNQTQIMLVNEDSELTIETVNDNSDQFADEFENFIQAIHKHANPFVTPSESIRNAELLERIRVEL